MTRTDVAAAKIAEYLLHRPAREGEVRHSRADISLARQYLGYEPAVSWREGLRRTWEHSPAPAPVAAERALAG